MDLTLTFMRSELVHQVGSLNLFMLTYFSVSCFVLLLICMYAYINVC